MKKNRSFFFLFFCFLLLVNPAFAKSVRGHLISSCSHLTKALAAPVKGIFVTGPNNVKNTWQYEVAGREKEEKCGALRYKAFAVWRAPGDEIKGVLDGCVECISESGESLKNLVSVFFSD